ncbi:hypothetical protein BDV40DRAFT_283834, partial [Aspergillus tamarii]
MPRYIASSVLLSEDSITPSLSASQIFTADTQNITEIALFLSISASPPQLNLVRTQQRKQIIQYPTEPEKLVVFETWWDQSPFAYRQRKTDKIRL